MSDPSDADGAQGSSSQQRSTRSTEALRAIYVGVGALAILNAAAIVAFHSNGATAAAVISAASAPIGTLVGAYFGMKTGTEAGSAGKAELEQSRSRAEIRSLALAAQMDPATASSTLRALGIPVA